MSKRTYGLIAAVVILVIAGVIVAQWQRARRTTELIEDLDTDSTDVAVDTLHELKKRGHRIEGRLLPLLNSDRRKERLRAALLLGEIGTPERSGPALERLLDDEWVAVRRAAAKALGRLGYGAAYSRLLEVVGDAEGDMDTRCMAVEAVGLLAAVLDEIDRELCVPPLARILEARPEVPPEEEEAEAEEEPEEAEEDALPEEAPPADTEIELRKECVLALGLLAGPHAVEALVESVNDRVEPSALVRQCACMALHDLPGLPADEALAKKVGRALLDALEDDAADVRMYAANALEHHTDFGSEPLDDAINRSLQQMAQELTEEGEPDYWVREAARLACNKRHVKLEPTEPETPTATEEGTS